MPLLKFHMYEGRTEKEITDILDVTHEAMVQSFNVPDSDRYQVVQEHKSYQMIMKDTGLGYDRTNQFILIHMISKKRTAEQMEVFYKNVAEALHHKCGISPTDIMFTTSPNGDEDWSFGEGIAQFLTGDL